MKREMRSVVGDVEKKGLIGMLVEGLIHKVKGVVGEDVGGVPFLLGVQMIDRILGGRQHLLVIEVHLTIAENCKIGINKITGSIKAVESAGDRRLLGFCTKMPFSCHHGAVTSLAKAFGQGRNIGQNGPAVAWNSPVSRHMAHPGLVLVNAGQQGRPGGTASTRVVKL